MTTGELIGKLSEFPPDDEVKFMVFSNVNPRRCDILERDVMIRNSPIMHQTNVMLNLPKYYDDEIMQCGNRLTELTTKNN